MKKNLLKKSKNIEMSDSPSIRTFFYTKILKNLSQLFLFCKRIIVFTWKNQSKNYFLIESLSFLVKIYPISVLQEYNS